MIGGYGWGQGELGGSDTILDYFVVVLLRM